jgi:hypothetical protein
MTGYHWLKPPLVSAPDPADRGKSLIYRISEHLLDCLESNFRHSPVFQIWAHVIGELPPINNIGSVNKGDPIPTLTTLEDSVACFQGVGRPYDDEENGESVLVYVLNPKVSLVAQTSMVCAAVSYPVPKNTCLTVQVKPFKTPLLEGKVYVHGVVTRCEYVPGDGGNPVLPKDFDSRYGTRRWSIRHDNT